MICIDLKKNSALCSTYLEENQSKASWAVLHKYGHLLISRCNFEKLCVTREFQQTLLCMQTSCAISKSPILHKKSKGGNTGVTECHMSPIS